jgi:GTPase SAR1 family protein
MNNKKDNNITNWYTKISKESKSEPKIDKNFKNHFILPNSRIALIGPSGVGKTNFMMEFLSRKNDSFYEVYIYTSNPDEPLLKELKKSLPEVIITSDLKDIPDLKEFPNEANLEKLIIWDDFITLNKKDMAKVNDYAIGSRKKGFTNLFMVQDFKSLPMIIRRNIDYFILFRLNDNISINNIIRNHNTSDIPKEKFKSMYIKATDQPRNFFLLDLKNPDKKYQYRSNFTHLFEI